MFMEPKRMGWRPTVQSWLLAQADDGRVDPGEGSGALKEPDVRAHIEMLFDWCVPPLLHFVQNGPKLLTPVTNIELVSSMVSMRTCVS